MWLTVNMHAGRLQIVSRSMKKRLNLSEIERFRHARMYHVIQQAAVPPISKICHRPDGQHVTCWGTGWRPSNWFVGNGKRHLGCLITPRGRYRDAGGFAVGQNAKRYRRLVGQDRTKFELSVGDRFPSHPSQRNFVFDGFQDRQYPKRAGIAVQLRGKDRWWNVWMGCHLQQLDT